MKACRKRSASGARFLNLLQISQLALGAGFATCRFRQNDLTRWGIVSKSLDRENKNGRPVGGAAFWGEAWCELKERNSFVEDATASYSSGPSSHHAFESPRCDFARISQEPSKSPSEMRFEARSSSKSSDPNPGFVQQLAPRQWNGGFRSHHQLVIFVTPVAFSVTAWNAVSG